MLLTKSPDKKCNAMVKMRGKSDVEKHLDKNVTVYKIQNSKKKNKFYRQCSKKRYPESKNKYCKTHNIDKDVINKNKILCSDEVDEVSIADIDLYFSEKKKKTKENDKDNLNLKKSKSVKNIDNFKPDLNFKITNKFKIEIENIFNLITKEPCSDVSIKQKSIKEVELKYNEDVSNASSSDEGEEVCAITSKDGTTFVYREETLEVMKISETNPNGEAIDDVIGILMVVSDKHSSINQNGKQYIISVNITRNNELYHMDYISKRCYQKNIKSEKLVYCGNAIEKNGILEIIKK